MAVLAPLGWDDAGATVGCQVAPTHRHAFAEVRGSMETLFFEQLWLTQVLSCFRLLASGFDPAARCAVGVKHSPIEVRHKRHCVTAREHLCSVEVKSACFSDIKPFKSRHRQAVSQKTVVNINAALDLA